jgi:hypothetical protein
MGFLLGIEGLDLNPHDLESRRIFLLLEISLWSVTLVN